tara:strand:+ start:578 stop:1147 length:570 start_codon:yes stop_codon:yes gene_type:complete
MYKLKIVLGSKSPRRQELIKELGIPFEVRTKEVEENYPSDLLVNEVAGYLAKLKAQPLIQTLKAGEVLLTSDTVVLNNGVILGKPIDTEDAIQTLRDLSGGVHEVITGVHMQSLTKELNFSNSTKVHFSVLMEEEITKYVEQFKPFDKAGSYGIQEWIGLIGVKKIDGCFYSVMGLPVHDVYQHLKEFN